MGDNGASSTVANPTVEQEQLRRRDSRIERRKGFKRNAVPSCAIVPWIGGTILAVLFSVVALSSQLQHGVAVSPDGGIISNPEDGIISKQSVCTSQECNGVMRIELTGPIFARLHTLCLGRSVARHMADVRHYYHWAVDEGLPSGRLSDFIAGPNFDVRYSKSDGEVEGGETVEMAAGECSREEFERLPSTWHRRRMAASAWPDPATMPKFWASVNESASTWLGWRNPPSCVLQQEMVSCYREVVPSPPLTALIQAEDLQRVRTTSAIYTQINHMAHENDTHLAHNAYTSGLGHIYTRYKTEAKAIRALTRRDLYKFVVVRNPFSRVVSGYLQKHIAIEPPRTRKQRNAEFSGKSRRLRKLARKSDDFIPFPDYLSLLEEVLQKHRNTMEAHIAPQMDMCLLNHIKYDFVGRFENLDEDVKTIMGRIGAPPMAAFAVGGKANPTGANKKLLAYINSKHMYDSVKRMYGMDMAAPLNGIVHEPPDVLKAMYGEAQDAPKKGG